MPNRITKVGTNNIRNSQVRDAKKIITFNELWNNFPSGYPCDKDAFSNQCAIRVAVALQNCGASLATYKGVCCWFHKEVKHALRAEELANWLNKRYLAGWPAATDITGRDWKEKAADKQGVIFFKDYWLRSGEKIPSGDHIDLWNGSRFPNTSPISWLGNTLRFGLGVDSIGIPYIQYSDLGGAKKILIWEIV